MKLGIDFGTCYSFPAIVINGEPRSLLSMKTNNGNRGIPSVFYFDKRNGEMVGVKAEAYGNRNPECVVANVKSELPNGTVYDLDGIQYSAGDICTRIIAKITSEANEQLETEFREKTVYEAVLSVPVRFGDNERTLLRKAAEVSRLDGGAGLTIKNFIQEPVAAAIDYGEMISTADQVLVYDLGGGTFDVALVIPTPFEEQPYRVVDFDGTEIGGKDFDERFAIYLQTVFMRDCQIDLSRDARSRHDLLMAARKAKEELSEDMRTEVEVQFDGLFYDVNVSREEFEEATKELIDETMDITKKLVERNNLVGSEHLHVVMVGGSSFMPQVKNGLQRILGEEARVHLHRPDKAIAFGAARFAANDNLVLQLASFSYGTNTYAGDEEKIANMVIAKTPLPTPVVKHEFETLIDGQTSVLFGVYENESREEYADIDSGRKLMDITLGFSAPVPRGTPVYVEMSLGDDGILLIKAVDPATNSYETASINVVRTE
ncbi:MAG: Hsp70 family protein [Firmicutes bacterium]|nr:Hsp70 family protein [Bacillota bacterium]